MSTWTVSMPNRASIASTTSAASNRAAEIRARTSLRLPDAYALTTVIHAEKRGWEDVRLETFEKALLRAHTELHPFPDG